MRVTIEEIIQATQGTLISGPARGSVCGVSINTRTLKKKELFIAIKGARLDGHRFVKQAVQKGARVMVVSRHVSVPQTVSLILVKNTTKALGALAGWYRRQFTIPIIAITGSAGKTSTKDITAHVLSARYNVLKNSKSENNQFGVPMTLLRLSKRHDVAVLELGTNQPGDIAYLANIVRPTVVVFTNIGESHLEKLKSVHGVFREKAALIDYLEGRGTIVYNVDDPLLRGISKKGKRHKHVTYSIKTKSRFQARLAPKQGQINFKVQSEQFALTKPVAHVVYNALVAICCGRLLGIGYNNIRKKISQYKGSSSRTELLRVGRYWVIDDTYNANPVSFRSALDTLTRFPAAGRRVLVCGDMLELGAKSKALHRQLGQQVAAQDIDVVFSFGTRAYDVTQAARFARSNKLYKHCRHRRELHNFLKKTCRAGDVVLVKGSRGMKLEETVAFLKKHLS